MKQTLSLLLFFFGIALSVIAHPIGIFTLVTDASALQAGDELLIVNIPHRVALGAQRVSNRNRSQAPIKVIDAQTIEPLGEVSVLTLGGYEDRWTLHDGNGTLKATDQDRNILETKTTRSSEEHLSISIREDNHAYLIFNIRKQFSHRQIWYNSGSELFSAFIDRQSNVQLFKRTRNAITLTVGSAGYATLFHRDHAFVVPAGVEAFTCHWATNRLQKGVVYASGQTLPKATAVLLHASPDTYTFESSAEEGTPDPQNILKGTDVTEPIPAQPVTVYYKFALADTQDPSSAGFYRDNENGDAFTNQANKVYLALPRNPHAATRFLMAGLPTSVIGVLQNKPSAKGIYTLDGCKCAQPLSRGIYIVDGKKVFIK